MPKIGRYLLVHNGKADPGALLWDGETPLDIAGEMIPEKEWDGEFHEMAPEPGQEKEREERDKEQDRVRITRDRARALKTDVDAATTVAGLRTAVSKLLDEFSK